MSDKRRIDAHQHFWCYDTEEYGWIDDDMSVLKRDFLPPDLGMLMQKVGIDGTIAVQARQSLEETAWLLDLADRYPFIEGVVGWFDLCREDVDAQLDMFGSDSKLVGVRHVVQDEPDDLFMLREDFLRGLAIVGGYDLCYEFLIFPKHLPAARSVVEKFPAQRFVVDHIAKPAIARSIIEPWRTELSELASFPNVYCKVSGMVTEADWRTWKPQDFKPYLDLVFDMFGPKRILIGSDWPVCTVAATYEDVIGMVKNYIERFSIAEQDAILGDNAADFYRIKRCE
jgi:L-fuconolactonase